MEVQNNASEIKYDIVISASNDKDAHYTKNWCQYNIDNKEDFLDLVTSKAYSNAIFNSTRYRNIENVESFGSCMIYDIDNDGDSNFTMNDAQVILVAKNISSMILPSKSHLIDKGKHGIKERFRIFIFMDSKYKIPANISKEVYKELMKSLATDMGFNATYDPAAAFDKARLYYPSPKSARLNVIEVQGNPYSIEKILTETLKKSADLFTYNKPLTIATTGNYLIKHYIYAYDYEKINIDVDFLSLINQTESVISQQQSKNKIKIKTSANNTYQFFIDTNLLWDFKNERTFNPITYTKFMNNLDKNISAIQMIEKTINTEYKIINPLWTQSFIRAMDVAKNSKELVELLKKYLGFNSLNIQNNAEDYIVVSGRKFHIKELDTSYKILNQLVKKFISNRKSV